MLESAAAGTIRIDTIRTFEGFRDHVRLQNLVWGYENADSVPSHLLVASSHNGAVVLGAYAGDALIGCLFGVPALRDKRLIHLSHLLAVHPAWRGQSIGERLKWRQREMVLQQDIGHVIWTYDPLETPNARLNLAHLGGRVSTYKRDYYGPMDDALNRGLPSDRFVVDWSLDAPWVHERLRSGPATPNVEGVPSALASRSGPDGIPQPGPFTAPTQDRALVQIPANMQELRQTAPQAAMSWRLATREAFELLFAAGYVATGITRQHNIACYVLEHVSTPIQ